MATTDLIYPGASWNGTVTWTNRTPPSDPTRTTFKPVARFGVVPYQDVTGDFTVPVLAYCKGGIASVQFWCEGNTVTVTAKSVVTEYEGRDFEAYTCVLDADQFPVVSASTGRAFDVYATVTPTDVTAQARVISIRLYFDGDGLLPKAVKYVSGSGTNSTSASGHGDTPDKAYASIDYAKERLAVAGALSGATIKLLPGSYTYTTDTAYGNFNRSNARWLTVCPNDGVDRSQVIITDPGPDSDGLRTERVRMRNITFQNATTAPILRSTSGALTDYLWVDGCHATGAGHQIQATLHQLDGGANWTGIYITDTYLTGYRAAMRAGTFARNVSIGTIGSDAFEQVGCVIVCDVDTIDKGGTDFHPDLWQSPGENHLLYGLKAGPGVQAQGVWIGDGPGTDLAVVNCDFGYVPDTLLTQWRNAHVHSHQVVLNNTWMGQHVLVDDGAARPYWWIEGNVFYTATIGSNVTGGTAALLQRNHFQSGTTYGTNATLGTPDWNPATRVPNDTGNLRSGAARLTLIDVDGNSRGATNAAIGAYAAEAEDGIDEVMSGGVAATGDARVSSTERRSMSGGSLVAGDADEGVGKAPIIISGGIAGAGAAKVTDLPTGYVIQPVVRFRVNLRTIQNTVTIGPRTNERTTGVPVLLDLQNQTTISFPGVGSVFRHGDEFLLQGDDAERTLRNHTTGVEGDYTSTPLMIVKRF